MIYSKLPVSLLTALTTIDAESPNAQLARYVLSHAGELGDLSVKELADACSVGVGTVSRFAREMGFANFSELREAFLQQNGSFERVAGDTAKERKRGLAEGIVRSMGQAVSTLDEDALARLVGDLMSYEKISTFGLLKAQAAATELQVGLLMQGKLVYTCTSAAKQFAHIERARSDELVVVFSYTGDYFAARDLGDALRRHDRPRIWMVCGARRPQPTFVHDCLVFESDLRQMGHPYQLLFAASLIAQEVAAAAGQ